MEIARNYARPALFRPLLSFSRKIARLSFIGSSVRTARTRPAESTKTRSARVFGPRRMHYASRGLFGAIFRGPWEWRYGGTLSIDYFATVSRSALLRGVRFFVRRAFREKKVESIVFRGIERAVFERCFEWRCI